MDVSFLPLAIICALFFFSEGVNFFGTLYSLEVSSPFMGYRCCDSLVASATFFVVACISHS
jgi:hypothetical protein